MGLQEAPATAFMLGCVYFGSYHSEPIEKYTCFLSSIYQMLF